MKKWNGIKQLCTALLCAGMFAFSASAADTRVPILMYHDLTTQQSEVSSMRITEERFRLDMEYLREFGYTPLQPAELLAIKNGTMQMPSKPVMITFDDGYMSNYTLAMPIMKQTGMKGAIAVVAYNIQTNENKQDRHTLSWNELREMSASGLFEVGLHTYNLHNPETTGNVVYGAPNGVQRLPDETQNAYNERVGSDLTYGLQLLRESLTLGKVNYFSYPFGAYDSWFAPLLDKESVGVSTLTTEGTADISGGTQALPRYRVTMERTVPDILPQPAAAAVPDSVTVLSDGVTSSLEAYNIGGNNYVRVRDVAALLAGSPNSFDVKWDASQSRVVLSAHVVYQPLGTENAALPQSGKLVTPIRETTRLDGTEHVVAAYNIDGSTFYKLRSLGELCDFGVDWDAQSQSVVIR